MHIIVNQDQLLKLKNLLSLFDGNYVDKKFNKFTLFLKDSNLFVIMNNNIQSCQLSIDVKIIDKTITNKILIDGKTFIFLINEIYKENSIEIFVHDNLGLEVKTNKFTINLSVLGGDFYKYEDENINTEEYKKIIIPNDVLRNIYVRFKDFFKHIYKNTIFNCINFKQDSDLRITVTDSLRVIQASFNLDNDSFEANLPFDTFLSIHEVIEAEDSKDFNWFLSKEYLIIKNNNLFLKIKVLTLNYPDFTSWFNIKSISTIEVSKLNLVAFLNRSYIWGNNSLNTKYTITKGKLLLNCRDLEKGFLKEEININNLEYKEDIEFWINNFLLKQLIKNINANTLIFKYNGDLKPITILEDNNTSIFKQFILPLNK